MAYRIIAKSAKQLDDICDDIYAWFKNTKDYKTEESSESRKFVDPKTQSIVKKDIVVIFVHDPQNGKETSLKFIPLLKPGEMKVEITGDNEGVMKGKIKNQLKGRGELKSYNKDTLRKMENISMKKSELKKLVHEELKKVLTESVTVTKTLGADDSSAKIIISSSTMGDVTIEVTDNKGKRTQLSILKDHLPTIINAFTEFYKKTRPSKMPWVDNEKIKQNGIGDKPF